MHPNGAVRRFPLKRKLLKQGERAEKAGGRPKDAPTAGKRLGERMGVTRQPEHNTGKAGVQRTPLRRGRGLVSEWVQCGSRSTAQGRRALKGPLQRRRAGTETRPYGGKDSLVAKSPSNKTGGYGGHNLQ